MTFVLFPKRAERVKRNKKRRKRKKTIIHSLISPNYHCNHYFLNGVIGCLENSRPMGKT